MTLRTNRTIAKLLGPALLLTAALSLPAVSPADASPNPKAFAAEKDKKDNKGKKNAKKNDNKAKVRQGNTARGNAAWKREQELREARRRAELNRQAELRRQAEARRYAQRNRVYRDDRTYRNRSAQRTPGRQEHLDGFVLEANGECVIFREHNSGQVFSLYGNVDELRSGDHLRYVGVHAYDDPCGSGYPAMELHAVKTLWANSTHNQAVYRLESHGSFDRYRGGYDDRYDDYGYGGARYEDDGLYFDGNGGDSRRLVSLDGLINQSQSACPTLRTAQGDLYSLSGNLRDYNHGDRVRVVGLLDGQSRCGGPAVEVREINAR